MGLHSQGDKIVGNASSRLHVGHEELIPVQTFLDLGFVFFRYFRNNQRLRFQDLGRSFERQVLHAFDVNLDHGWQGKKVRQPIERHGGNWERVSLPMGF